MTERKAPKRGHDAAQTVERLRQVQTAGGSLPGAELGGVRIGGSLQHGQAASDDEQRR